MTKLDKTIFAALFFSLFGTVTGVGIVVPLLPVYAMNLGASGVYIGLIFGAFSISRTFLLPWFGRLSDKKGRKPFIVTGLLCYALVSVAFIFAQSVESLIIIRFMQGIASAMIMPAVQAYIGDITPDGREGFTMGLFNMSMFMGLSLGPLIGGVIQDRFSLDISFASMGLLAAAGFLLSLFILPPAKSEKIVLHTKKPKAWKWLIKDPEISGICLFRLAYASCIGIIWSFLPVLADSKFSLSSSYIGILVMTGVLSSGIMHVPMGIVADKINRKLMVTAGGMVIAYAILSFQWAGGFRDLMKANLLFGLGGGIAMPALMAIGVIKGTASDAMGSVMGLLAMSHSFGMLAGSLLAGIVMDIFTLNYAFGSGSVIMLVCLGLFITATYKKDGTLPVVDVRAGHMDIEI